MTPEPTPDRSFGPVGAHPLLFEVLNQIDDADVTFILTTNRVDILERALSERPGRVDVAVEIASPDDVGRARLLRLYGAGLGVDELSEEDLAPTITATAGRTATFLREAVRRAALDVALGDGDGPLRLDGPTLATAVAEFIEDRTALTRAVLAGADAPDAEPPLRAAVMPAMGIARPMMAPGAPVPPPFAPDER